MTLFTLSHFIELRKIDMTISQQLELFPELASPINYAQTTYTLDTNGSIPYTLNYTIKSSIDDQMRLMSDLADKVEVKVYKLFPEAHMPELGTEWAACFDLKASMRDGDIIKVIGLVNRKREVSCHNGSFVLYSGERCLVPTGLVFDLDDDQSMRIHPRSGLAWKQGISLANCEGVVDADYVQQTYVMLINNSSEVFTINDGDRIAQAEVIQHNSFEFVEVHDEPQSKTSRTGGFGSTGV
jgi:dUTP pyrophosphatase